MHQIMYLKKNVAKRVFSERKQINRDCFKEFNHQALNGDLALFIHCYYNYNRNLYAKVSI